MRTTVDQEDASVYIVVEESNYRLHSRILYFTYFIMILALLKIAYLVFVDLFHPE